MLNVRVDDHVRDALDDLAAAEGVSLSELVRDRLREVVVPVGEPRALPHGDEPAPESLSFMDRKLLSMLHRILARVLSDEDEDGEDGGVKYQLERAHVLERGLTGEYWMESAGFVTELSKSDSWRVIEILEMFRVVTFSIKELANVGTPVDDDLQWKLSFRGFDHNDPLERHMAQYVDYLIKDGRWAELKSAIAANDRGNSHRRMLGVYGRMLTVYRRIMEARERGYSDDYFLSVVELADLVSSQVHPSNRRIA